MSQNVFINHLTFDPRTESTTSEGPWTVDHIGRADHNHVTIYCTDSQRRTQYFVVSQTLIDQLQKV